MGTFNRRQGLRMPLQLFLNTYSEDKTERCMSLNISPDGIFLNRLFQPETQDPSTVVMEFQLPGMSEVIWAKGEVCYDKTDEYFHKTGVRFTTIAKKHRELLKDYINDYRVKRLKSLLTKIRQNRLH